MRIVSSGRCLIDAEFVKVQCLINVQNVSRGRCYVDLQNVSKGRCLIDEQNVSKGRCFVGV
jgi:hypothetical protein